MFEGDFLDSQRYVKQTKNRVFDREGSTVSYMDDFQIAIHTYDGCVKSCTGCVVDKELREIGSSGNELLISKKDAQIIHKNVKEFYEYLQKENSVKDRGYFSKGGRKLNNYSYTYRFGNHAQVPLEVLREYVKILDTGYNVFSSGAGIVPHNIIALSDEFPEKKFLVEFIYDPIKDEIGSVVDTLNKTFGLGVHGYIEMVLNKKIIDKFTPVDFADNFLCKLNEVDRPLQVQLGKYVPNKNRMYGDSLVPELSQEIAWLTELAELIVERRYQIYILPLGEYAVTIMDDYHGEIDEGRDMGFTMDDYNGHVIENVLDLMKVSIFIERNLDVYHWSENIGQQVLDGQYEYPPLGNLRENSLIEILSEGNLRKYHYKEELKGFFVPMCQSCAYMSFCATHSLDLFRKMIKKDRPGDIESKIENCFGYIPVINAFKDRDYLESMIRDFRNLDF